MSLFGFVLFFLGCQSGRGHFLVYAMKLELAALLALGSVEDSFGYIFFILAIVVVEGAVGLSLLVSLCRSTGEDRSSLGALVSQVKWEKFQKKSL
uniref:NADH dehydrogenase subunit 4L n=1 Tax=Spirobranchus giganteus TaxID=1914524 RepID=A0A1I9WKB2_9ANNE|nr:NADH dehydrogenase subunit 4L [Spirobranchus giganteus]APA32607.1 NADH dehydrogenase subunit 4L [Spirobranchus giganteus]